MRKADRSSEKVAEFIGILLGDGSVGRYKCESGDRKSIQHVVKVTLSSKEKDYADYVCYLFRSLFEVYPKKYVKEDEAVCELRCFKKVFFEHVTQELGVKKSPKWFNAEVPDYVDGILEKHLLRDYFDTDGSLVLADNNGTLYPRIEMKVCPAPMQKQIINMVESLGFNFGVYDIGKGKVRIQINGVKQTAEWFKIIGPNNKKHINKFRKLATERPEKYIDSGGWI